MSQITFGGKVYEVKASMLTLAQGLISQFGEKDAEGTVKMLTSEGFASASMIKAAAVENALTAAQAAFEALPGYASLCASFETVKAVQTDVEKAQADITAAEEKAYLTGKGKAVKVVEETIKALKEELARIQAEHVAALEALMATAPWKAVESARTNKTTAQNKADEQLSQFNTAIKASLPEGYSWDYNAETKRLVLVAGKAKRAAGTSTPRGPRTGRKYYTARVDDDGKICGEKTPVDNIMAGVRIAAAACGVSIPDSWAGNGTSLKAAHDWMVANAHMTLIMEVEAPAPTA
jgi:hypothetical protein